MIFLFILLLSMGVEATAIATAATDNPTVCQISFVIPFFDSRRDIRWHGSNDFFPSDTLITKEEIFVNATTILAIGLMAIEDFNSRSSSILSKKDLERYDACPVQLEIGDVFDGSNLNGLQRDILLTMEETENEGNYPCAIVGPNDNEALNLLMETLGTASGQNIPIFPHGRDISLSSLSGLVGNFNSHGRIILTTVDWEDRMRKLWEYLVFNDYDRAALLFSSSSSLATEAAHSTDDNSSSGRNMNDIKIMMNEPPSDVLNVTQVVADATIDDYTERITNTLTTVKKLDIEVLIIAWERDDRLDDLAGIAMSLGMLSKDYVWVFMDSYFPPKIAYKWGIPKKDSALERLMYRAFIYESIDPLVPRDLRYGRWAYVDFDKSDQLLSFEDDWKTRQSDLLRQAIPYTFQAIKEHVNDDDTNNINDGINSVQDLKALFFSQDEQEVKETFWPPYGSAFVYDSIMAIGMAACENYNNSSNVSSDKNNSVSILQALSSLSFEGASGLFEVDDFVRESARQHENNSSSSNSNNGISNHKSRKIDSVDHGMYVLDRIYHYLPFNASLHDYTKHEGDGNWIIHRKHFDVFLFDTTRRVGFALSVISITVCVGSMIFIYRNRTQRVVLFGQPIFLYIVCAASSLFGISIIFQSYDDTRVENHSILNSFCEVQNWLAYIGQIFLYMAIFSKLWRVRKLTSLRKRQQILARHVIWPFAVATFGVTLTLIGLSLFDPPKFFRLHYGDDDYYYSEDDDRSNQEEQAENDDDIVDDDLFRNGTIPFCSVSLWAIFCQVFVIIALCSAFVLSYQLRTLRQEHLSDSWMTFTLLATHVITAIVGIFWYIIFVFIGWYNIGYLVRAFINFIFAVAGPLCLVGPKMYYVWSGTLPRELRPRKGGRVHISGLAPPRVTRPTSPPNYHPTGSSSAPTTTTSTTTSSFQPTQASFIGAGQYRIPTEPTEQNSSVIPSTNEFIDQPTEDVDVDVNPRTSTTTLPSSSSSPPTTSSPSTIAGTVHGSQDLSTDEAKATRMTSEPSIPPIGQQDEDDDNEKKGYTQTDNRDGNDNGKTENKNKVFIDASEHTQPLSSTSSLLKPGMEESAS